MCRVCWSADAVTDVILSGKGTKAITKQDSGTNACCSYGISGMNGIQGVTLNKDSINCPQRNS